MKLKNASKEVKAIKPIRKNGGRVKRVFDKAIEELNKGKTPIISKIMREEGYSPSASACVKVLRTATWKQLRDSLNKNEIMDVFTDLISRENTDKRTRLSAAVELCKLMDFYPSKKITKLDETNAATAKYFSEKEDNGW